MLGLAFGRPSMTTEGWRDRTSHSVQGKKPRMIGLQPAKHDG